MRIIMKKKKKMLSKDKVMTAKIVNILLILDSLSEKKVRKNAKKSDIRKHQQQHYTAVNSKEIKYPTRNKTRQI